MIELLRSSPSLQISVGFGIDGAARKSYAKVILHVADRAVELTKKDTAVPSAKAFRFSGYTPPLVVRLYHQTDDESVRIRCLDLLDAMLAFGWNEVAMEMAKAER